MTTYKSRQSTADDEWLMFLPDVVGSHPSRSGRSYALPTIRRRDFFRSESTHGGTVDWRGSSPTDTEPAPDLAAEFERLADEWHRETGFISSSRGRVGHRSYQRIIDMGWTIVPTLLRDLPERDWFAALARITGENPVPVEARGDRRAMTQAWVSWGQERGLV